MTFLASATSSSIHLPSTVAIGFTGHRKLADEAKCQKLIIDYLKERKAAIPGMVYGVSSVAAGADLLFSESCVQLGIPLRILLPLPQEQFQSDFDAVTWARAKQVLSKAVSVEVTGTDQPREERYYECGIEIVHQSQLLIALWNGEPAEGLGGTEKIVSFATELDRPVVWLNSVSWELRTLNAESEHELLHDPELDFLNQLPDPTRRSGSEANTPVELARAWLFKLDENASRFAPEVRHLATIPIVCTAAGALFSGAASWAHAATWLVLGAVLGVTAAALPAALRLNQRQLLWVRTRTAAEVCRSMLALWSTPAPYDAIGPEVVPELSGMLRSLNLLKMLDRGKGEISLEEFRRRYNDERLSLQISYFSAHAEQSAAEARIYKTATWVSTVLAILLNAWLLVNTQRFAGFNEPQRWRKWVALASSIAFQAATILGAMLVVNDCERRRQRYRELHRMLAHWATPLKQLRTWPSVLRFADRIEKALLVEMIEWRSLIRNRKLHKK